MKRRAIVLSLLLVSCIGLSIGLYSCGKSSGIGVGGKVIIMGSGN